MLGPELRRRRAWADWMNRSGRPRGLVTDSQMLNGDHVELSMFRKRKKVAPDECPLEAEKNVIARVGEFTCTGS